VLVCVFMASKQIDLSNPAKIGAELLKDPNGEFALDVWETYCRKPFAHLGVLYPLPVLSWRTDPSDPQFAPLDPQQAVDEAFTWVTQALILLKSDPPAEAIEAVQRALKILARGSSLSQPKRGHPASMRPFAVRAWAIRKFNPHPTKPSESTVGWAELTNLLFVEKGKCTRCRRPRHQYNSPCANALSTAFRNLCSAMEHDGIPA
jgi:hypothetical protein